MYRLYQTLTTLLTPVAHLWLRIHPRHNAAHPRLRPKVPSFSSPPIILHACSVGEYNAALPIYSAFRQALPHIPVLLTLSTPTAYALAQEKSPDIPTAYFPLDLPGSVRQFLDTLQPRALVQVETEIWPNIFIEAHKRNIPIAIINARISDRHYPRYLRVRRAFRPVFAAIAAVGAQNDRHAERFVTLGCPAEHVHVNGNTKFDALNTALPEEIVAEFREECGLDGTAPIVTFGSTRPGDEVLAAACWRQIQPQYPNARIIIAPRHPQRADEITALFPGVEILRRSRIQGGKERPAGQAILLLDTLGELLKAYACADVAVVGGSFHPGVNGHNPLEPAALGIPTLFGPFIANFEDAARALIAADAAIQLHHPNELPIALLGLLADPARQGQLKEHAQAAIAQNVGAIQRNVEMVAALLGEETK